MEKEAIATLSQYAAQIREMSVTDLTLPNATSTITAKLQELQAHFKSLKSSSVLPLQILLIFSSVSRIIEAFNAPQLPLSSKHVPGKQDVITFEFSTSLTLTYVSPSLSLFGYTPSDSLSLKSPVFLNPDGPPSIVKYTLFHSF